MNPIRLYGLALAAFAAGVALAYSLGMARAPAGAPCPEDAAYVVVADHDPRHGLTWECIALDDLLELEREHAAS